MSPLDQKVRRAGDEQYDYCQLQGPLFGTRCPVAKCSTCSELVILEAEKRPLPQGGPLRMPAGSRSKTLTAHEAANAIFVDFEGTKTEAISSWVVRPRSWTATVLESALKPLVPQGHPRGSVQFRSMAVILGELQEMSINESRMIVCWSERERTAIYENQTLDLELRAWWKDNLVNILKPAKRWARENGVKVPAIVNSYGKETSASLTGFRRATGYEAVTFETLNTATPQNEYERFVARLSYGDRSKP